MLVEYSRRRTYLHRLGSKEVFEGTNPDRQGGAAMKSDRKENEVQPTGELALTPRERQVYQLLQLGKANKEIATALGIQVRTVCFHVENVLHKLGISRREIFARSWQR
jgi:DNA-binding NarL/FixJ family response regulator